MIFAATLQEMNKQHQIKQCSVVISVAGTLALHIFLKLYSENLIGKLYLYAATSKRLIISTK